MRAALELLLVTAAMAECANFAAPPVFTVAPLSPDQIREIIPLGNLNPRGGHVFPTDHVYFDYGGRPGLPVTAPATGVVFAIRDQSGGDFKVEVRVDAHLSYYLAHLFVGAGIEVGHRVQAGQVVGRASGRSCLDLGASDTRVRPGGFTNPARYPTSMLQALAPLALFAEPLKTRLYAKVSRDGPDKDGRIDFDQPGRLVGNWFHQRLSVREAGRGGPEIAPWLLAFVYDVRRPRVVRISIGGTVAPPGVYAVPPDGPDPATVSLKTGVVKYTLLDPNNGAQGATTGEARGVLLVQLLSDTKAKAQYFPGKTVTEVRRFTTAASIYER